MPRIDLDLSKERILITGGTGSFGKRFVRTLLDQYEPKKVIILSRDEQKHFQMMQEFDDPRLRWFVGDVRDAQRLNRAFGEADIVVHAAAMKHIPIAEYNPLEAIKTNVLGAANVIDAAINRGVRRVVALSSDKAANPVNLYGATKLCADKLFVAGGAYTSGGTTFSVVRYGNVIGSKGSVIPAFRDQARTGVLRITDERMTRFWIQIDRAIELVLLALLDMQGGEIYVPKMPSMKITDLARAIAPEARHEAIGIRPGEKLHETMIPSDEARNTLEFEDHYILYPPTGWWRKAGPEHSGGRPVPDGFVYASDLNDDWLTEDEIRRRIEVL